MGKRSKKEILSYTAVLNIFLFTGAGTFENPAVQSIIDAWPTVSVTLIRMLTTLPCLISLPVTLWIGYLAGNKIRYKTCAILGSILIIVGGTGPFMFHSSWIMVLFFRLLLGIGVGCYGIRNAVIIHTVPEEQQEKYTGYGGAILNGGALIFNLLAGYLVSIQWNYVFLLNLLCIIPCIYIALFMKEPEKVNSTTKREKSVSKKMDGLLIIYVVYQFFTSLAIYPLLSGISTYMETYHLGNAVMAGAMIAVYSVGAIAANVIIDILDQKLKKWLLAVMCFLTAAGYAGMLCRLNMLILIIGVFFCGACFNVILSILQVYNARSSSEENISKNSGIILAVYQFAMFSSSYYILFCHRLFQKNIDIESCYWGSMIVYLILAIMACVLIAVFNKKDSLIKDEKKEIGRASYE